MGTAGWIVSLSLGAFAAEPETKKIEKEKVLPPLVITATKTETEAWRTASSITLVDRAKIEQQQMRLVPDALRAIPGMAIVDNGGPGTLAGVFVRGTKTANTAVLIDGRPVPANLAGSFNIETTPLDNVERVEVLRGPAASLYGGRTIGGVINIITRSGKGLAKPETTVYAETGSYGTFREGLSSIGAAGALDWGLELTQTNIQGQRINSQFQNSSAAGKLGYDITDTLRFDLDARYYNAEVGVPGPAAGFGANDPDAHLLNEFWSLSPRLIWDTTDIWQQSLTYSAGNFRQVATGVNFAGGNNRITARTHFWEYQSVIRPTEQWTITAGAWLQDQSYSRYNDDAPGIFNPGGRSYDVDQAETNWALFLQTQAEVLPGLNLLGGVRYDHYSDFGNETTWRAGISYRVPVTATLLHVNYGTAFAPPTPQDREPALFGLASLLRPETSRGVEFGIEQPFASDKMSLSLTWFRNDIRNYIEFDPTIFALQQIDKARTQGAETAFRWTPCARFGLDLSYTYLDADNISDSRRLVRRPRHTLTSSAWVKPVEKVHLGLSAVYSIDREDGFGAGQSDQEDYLNVRLTASWQVCKNFEIFGRIENLLGDDYQEARGFPAYDTGAYAGVKLRF